MRMIGMRLWLNERWIKKYLYKNFLSDLVRKLDQIFEIRETELI